MRASVLSILAAAALLVATSAKAQVPIPDDFAPKTYGPHINPSNETVTTEELVSVEYRPESRPSVRTDHGFSVPLGSLRLVGNGTSYRPTDNEKIRNERLQVAFALSEDVDLMIGARRHKYRQEGLFSEREVTFGIDLNMPIDYVFRLF